jgi:hypothetical protein
MLRPTFWFGMAMCDTQSAPEWTQTCAPDSDGNVYDSPDPSAVRYIGHHPGGAYMELQFYPPGWASSSDDASRWSVALTIDSYNLNQNTNVPNNSDCLRKVGIEPVNFAYLTTSGVSDLPADPLYPTFITFNPATDLLLNQGDSVTVQMYDTADGLKTVVTDDTTGASGSMTASVANGFAQVNYDPSATTCTSTPYAFHPMYATSSEHTRLSWTAHGYNVAYSDEIGHFELCADAAIVDFQCTASHPGDPKGADVDDGPCFPSTDSLFVMIGGCTGSDYDFDGVPYNAGRWPGTLGGGRRDANLHASSVIFTSPTFNGHNNYDRVAFETDTPRIEATDLGFGGTCQRFSPTGTGCTAKPKGAQFYPIYSTNTLHGSCAWGEGGPSIPGWIDNFGGSPKSEYSPLLQLFYPVPGGPSYRYNDFRNVLGTNPCPSTS